MASPDRAKRRPPVAAQPDPGPRASRSSWLGHPAVFFILFALIVYRAVLGPGMVLFTTDDNIGALALRRGWLPQSFLGGWDDSIALGQPVLTHFTWTNLLLYLLPLRFFTNWIHALDLVVGSLAIAGWLRARGFSRPAQLIGAFTALWVGSTFFLTYAGHIGKFGVVMFAALYLFLVERAIAARSWAWAALAGGAMGGMFLEQADVALFFALPLGAYAVWGAVREHGLNLQSLLRVPLATALVAGLMAVHPAWMGHALFALERGEALAEKSDDDQANWEYCTQWSWPPEETIEFVVPGYLGWRSGEPAGPYWGRMGQSAEWPRTGQGFRNFRLETLYLGCIPVWLALAGLFLGGRQGQVRRGDVLFWGAVALLTFLLALGKFTPLYRLFYALPGISSIRNPVKFMQVFQFALAFLAAVGMDALRAPGNEAARLLARRAGWAMCGAGILFAVWAMGLGGSLAETVARFNAEGWGGYGSVMARNMVNGLTQAAVVCLLGGGILWFALPRGTRGAAPWAGAALLLVAAVDQLIVSRHYVQAIRSDGFFAPNVVTKYLRQESQSQRVYLLTQQSFYNLWLTYLFPYHQIPSLNITQMRMSEDYKAFFAATQSQPLRLWQMAAVGTVIGPMDAARQVAGTPEGSALFQPAAGFNVAPASGGGVAVAAAPTLAAAQHVILRHTAPAPRFQLIGAWRVLEADQVLAELARSDRPLFDVALLGKSTAGELGDQLEQTGSAGKVDVLEHRSGFARLRVHAERDAILRAADKFEQGWTCTVAGKPTPVMRCDHVCLGVRLPAGTHEVVLAFRPDAKSLYAQMAGLGACALAGMAILLRRRPGKQIAHPEQGVLHRGPAEP